MATNMADISGPKVIDIGGKNVLGSAVGGKNSQSEVMRDSSQAEDEHEYDYGSSEDDDMSRLLASLSAEELYKNLTAASDQFPAVYHPSKSADFQSFETVANPDADITVRKVRAEAHSLVGL
jgi:hypothetical protein